MVASHNLTCRHISVFNMARVNKVRLRISLNGVKLACNIFLTHFYLPPTSNDHVG